VSLGVDIPTADDGKSLHQVAVMGYMSTIVANDANHQIVF